MNISVIIIGTIAFMIGIPVFIYRIKVYPDRASGKRGGFFLPGVEPGTFKDKLFYAGTALGFALMGLLWVITELLK